MSRIKISGIYKIQSKIKPDRIYIGSAVDIFHRWDTHLCALRKNQHQPKLQNHFNKYGDQDLIFSILLQCDKKDLIQQEQNFIDLLNPYFNLKPIAGRSEGFKWSEESKNKIRGKKASEETRDKLSKAYKGKTTWMKGKKHTEEARQKMSKSHIGQISWLKGKKGALTISEETRLKLSEAGKRYWQLKKLKENA